MPGLITHAQHSPNALIIHHQQMLHAQYKEVDAIQQLPQTQQQADLIVWMGPAQQLHQQHAQHLQQIPHVQEDLYVFGLELLAELWLALIILLVQHAHIQHQLITRQLKHAHGEQLAQKPLQ